jgi:hypothetical protein
MCLVLVAVFEEQNLRRDKRIACEEELVDELGEIEK